MNCPTTSNATKKGTFLGNMHRLEEKYPIGNTRKKTVEELKAALSRANTYSTAG